jgi:hypothetical protein
MKQNTVAKTRPQILHGEGGVELALYFSLELREQNPTVQAIGNRSRKSQANIKM